ncbi:MULTISPECIES: hypothetical protein [Rhodococcus]|uniref:hypothetical protein n=1 Tax=Rhodococcus TaxID=1827 RepID=UPI000C99E9C1|nr:MULTISPECIES: hypothetical protein [Rhodococcus]PND51690.1 hypothetical protein CQZ88_12600 [Rhodococcus sp. ENV425]WKW96939.1 hypothetical protein Q3O43_18040 [Rhodococcus aetherivorans]
MALALEKDRLVFEFPEVHAAARMAVSFHRTLRVPDDGNTYPLPPGLGRFPLRAVAGLDDARIPDSWRSRGGLVMPMWQSEACWLGFESRYPFLVKVAAGDVDALTGETWSPVPDFEREDYLEVPAQPWLDGFVVAQGRVRQFVAMPLGSGYGVEEQLRSGPAQGGIRIAAYPIRARRWEERAEFDARRPMHSFAPAAAMGLGAGGSVEQGVATPVEPHDAWDLDHRSVVDVHLVTSEQWRTVTGEDPPTRPLAAADYTGRGFPWFELYDETVARQGAQPLADVDTVADVGRRRGEPLPGNETVTVPEPIRIRPAPRDPGRRG